MNATLKIAFDASTKRHKDANGYLHIDSSHITKEQVVGYYGYELGYEREGIDPDRIYYAYRPAEELVKAVSTFNGVPAVDDASVFSPLLRMYPLRPDLRLMLSRLHPARVSIFINEPYASMGAVPL